MSTLYQIFIQDKLVSEASLQADGTYDQVFPRKETFQDKRSWLFEHVMVFEDVKLVYPDGTSILYHNETYHLSYNNRLASSGVQIMGEFYKQTHPTYRNFMSRDALLCTNAKYFGVETYLHIVSKAPKVSLSVAPKPVFKDAIEDSFEDSDEEDDIMVHNPVWSIEDDEPPNPVWDLETNTITQPSSSKDKYWDPNDRDIHPSIAMVLKALYEDGKGPRRSNEGCDCGNC